MASKDPEAALKIHPGAQVDGVQVCESDEGQKTAKQIHASSESSSSSDASKPKDAVGEKNQATQPSTALKGGSVSTAGITLFVRKSKGTTRSLSAQDNLLVLLDGPYHNNHHKSTLRCDRLLLIGGGIGISGLLPWLNVHPNVKLCWTVKALSGCLAESMEKILQNVAEKDIGIGRRLNIPELLRNEVACGWEKIGVVVCGPNGLCDDARAAVIEAAKRGPSVFEMEVDAYSW